MPGHPFRATTPVEPPPELCGVLNASRRLSSWQAGLELAAVAELDARRAGPGGRRYTVAAEPYPT
jgi:hypothetical protein